MVAAGGPALAPRAGAALQFHWGCAVPQQPPGALRPLYGATHGGGVLLQVAQLLSTYNLLTGCLE